MSHDHPVDPYRNQLQGLLNILNQFAVTFSTNLRILRFTPLKPSGFLWLIESNQQQYMLFVDDLITSLESVRPALEAEHLEFIASYADDTTFIADTTDFNQAVLARLISPQSAHR